MEHAHARLSFKLRQERRVFDNIMSSIVTRDLDIMNLTSIDGVEIEIAEALRHSPSSGRFMSYAE
jgi:hypothetical protein